MEELLFRISFDIIKCIQENRFEELEMQGCLKKISKMKRHFIIVAMLLLVVSIAKGESMTDWELIKEENIIRNKSVITIQILASIEKSSNNNYLRDDSEQWRIIVKGQSGNEQIIFEEDLRMGCIDMFVDNDKVCFVVDTSESFSIYDLYFSKIFKKYFLKKAFKRNKSKPSCLLSL